jgi:hypothetical protein
MKSDLIWVPLVPAFFEKVLKYAPVPLDIRRFLRLGPSNRLKKQVSK